MTQQDSTPLQDQQPQAPQQRTRIFLNAGSGPADNTTWPAMFGAWKQIRVDIDPATAPDLLASISDLGAIASGSVDAVWASHCVEHLYAHQVQQALAEFRRVLSADGFACIVVPDLQAIANMIVADKLHEVIYQSAAGPVTAHDMLWGFGPSLAAGNLGMAHHCGFTPTPLLKALHSAGFEDILLRRKSTLELVALAMCRPAATAEYREQLIAQLGF